MDDTPQPQPLNTASMQPERDVSMAAAAAAINAQQKPEIPEHVKNDPRYAEFVTEVPMQEDLTQRAAEIDRRYMAATEHHQKRTVDLEQSVMSELSRPAVATSAATQSAKSRRSEAVTLGGNFLLPEQQVVLVNLASRFLNPRSRRPAVRILGLFPSADHARAHAARLLRIGAIDVDLHLVPAQRPFLIASSKEQQQDAEFVLREIKSRQDEYAQFRRRGEDSLKQSVAERAQGEKGASAFAAKVKSRNLVNPAREHMLDALAQAKDENRTIGDVLSSKTTTTTTGVAKMAGGRRLNKKMSIAQQARQTARDAVTKAAAEARKRHASAASTNATAAAAAVPTDDETATTATVVAASKSKIPFEKLVETLQEQAYVNGQRFACVSFLLDYSATVLKLEADPKPAVCVYAAFATVDDAEKYIENTASKYETDFHIDVVDMYQWLHPEDVEDDKLTEVYRDPELNRIMNARKREKQRLDDFESFCREIKQDTPTTEVTLKDRETGEVDVKSNVPGGGGWKDVKLTQHDSKTNEPLPDLPELGKRVITSETTVQELEEMYAADVASRGDDINDPKFAHIGAVLSGESSDKKMLEMLARADESQDRLMQARLERAR